MRLFYRILLHVLFWSFILYYNTALLSYSDNEYLKHFTRLLYTLPFDMLAVYFTLYFIIPKFLLKKKYILFVFVLLISAIGIILIARYVNFRFVYPWVYPERYTSFKYWSFVSILNNIFGVYSVVSMAAAFKLFKLWFKSHKQRVNLEKQNLKSELALLRVQINPHFLFNTLNNIDSLVQSNSVEASNALIKLSDIMRYMLYDASIDKVPLEKELEYIESYVSLEKLRQRDNRFTVLEINDRSNGFMIAPMLLVPFIENAFKHGSKDLGSPGIIIKISNEAGQLNLYVMNYFNEAGQKDKTQGIGLQNVNRRLELLYPEKHDLIISREDKKYIVNLKIDLL
ncbi:sensor histidine kinase [Bacteroidota bacterium]